MSPTLVLLLYWPFHRHLPIPPTAPRTPSMTDPLQGFVFVHGIDPYVTANGVKRYEIALLGKGSEG